MAITAADFRVEYPEFSAAPDALVDAKLSAATHFCDASKWGARYQDGVFLKAAHLIAMSPSGEKMRIAKGSKETLYSSMFDDMLMALPVRTLTT